MNKYNLPLAAGLLAVVFHVPLSRAASWTQFTISTQPFAFAPYSVGHLSDGRFVHGLGGAFYLQDAWGSAASTAFGGVPSGIDPSFIAVINDSAAVAGGGGFGASVLYAFNPSDTATPGFAATPYTVQNYAGVLRDASSLYIGGLYSGFTHGVTYATLDGATVKLIIGNVSTFSAGMAIDAAGNLYVGDTDDGTVRKFTSAQLTGAIAGPALSMTDGEFVYDFGDGGNIGSLAVDGLGRVWAAGFLHDGLRVYDPSLGQEAQFIPNLANANYSVYSFSRLGESYVGFVNQQNPATESSNIYGYAPAKSLVVPEPSTALLALAGAAVFAAWRRIRA